MGLLCLPAYVLPVKVEMGMVIQQYEKAKVIQDEQLERLTQICQEQGVRYGSLWLRPVLLMPVATGALRSGSPCSPLRDTKGT